MHTHSGGSSPCSLSRAYCRRHRCSKVSCQSRQQDFSISSSSSSSDGVGSCTAYSSLGSDCFTPQSQGWLERLHCTCSCSKQTRLAHISPGSSSSSSSSKPALETCVTSSTHALSSLHLQRHSGRQVSLQISAPDLAWPGQ